MNMSKRPRSSWTGGGLETMSKGFHIRIPLLQEGWKFMTREQRLVLEWRIKEERVREFKGRSEEVTGDSFSFHTQPERSPCNSRAQVEHL